ncbi:MAG: ATP-binding protein [Muribaculaceae bacterium]|nr:ATP-binding protein [Muribaculaceae bacterium]
MATKTDATPLWLSLKIEYIDENFQAVQEYLHSMSLKPDDDKDSFYYTTIDLLNQRIEKLIQNEYSCAIAEIRDKETEDLHTKLLCMYLIVADTKHNLFKDAFLLFIHKIITFAPKQFNDSFIEQIINIDYENIDISKIITWRDFGLFSYDVFAHKLTSNYQLPQSEKMSKIAQKGLCIVTTKGLSIFATRKLQEANTVGNMQLFNNKLQIKTNKINKIKQNDAASILALEEFTESFIEEQRKDAPIPKKNYHEGSVCNVVVTDVNTDIYVKTTDAAYNTILGKIDFTKRFFYYNKSDFLTNIKIGNRIDVTYIGDNRFSIFETFSNLIYDDYHPEHLAKKVLATVIEVKDDRNIVAWGTEYGYSLYTQINGNEYYPGDMAKVRVGRLGLNSDGTPNGYVYGEFVEFDDEILDYKGAKAVTISKFVDCYTTDECMDAELLLGKGLIKTLYRILMEFQYHCVESASKRYQILCTCRIMSELVEQKEDSKYIKFVLDYLKNLIFFATGKFNQMRALNYEQYDTSIIARRKSIIDILMKYGDQASIDMAVFEEKKDEFLLKLAKLVESCNRLDGVITAQMKNIIKREIMKYLRVPNDSEDDNETNIDEENGKYFGIEDNLKEFKTSIFYAPSPEINQKENVFKGICAFLNTTEGGVLYLGVDDIGYEKGIVDDINYLETKVYGTYRGVDGLIRYITDEMKKYFDIDVLERVKIFAISNNNVLSFNVQPYEFGVVKMNNKVYLRINSESIDITANANAIKHIEQRKFALAKLGMKMKMKRRCAYYAKK